MKIQLQVMEVVVQRAIVDRPPEDYDSVVDVVPTVFDAQSDPNLIPLSSQEMIVGLMTCRQIILRVSLWHRPLAVSFIGITCSFWSKSTLLISFS